MRYKERFQVFTAVTMNNAVLWDVTARGSCETHVEKSIVSVIRVTRNGDLGTTLAVTNNRSTLC
jgi:hypothetical protein